MASIRNVVVQQVKNIERDSSWANLPADIVCSIMNRLYYADQIRFRAVCKDWREVNIQGMVKPADKLPWVIAIVSNLFYLYDPIYRRKYTVDTNPQLFIDTIVLASKYGWILFAKKDGPEFRYNNFLFFYNPFTNQIIALPELHMKTMKDQATFTRSPLSKECEIYAVRVVYSKIFISMCRPGDTTWTELFFLDIQEYEKTLSESYELHLDGHVWCPAIEYVQGVVYFVLGSVSIAAFDVLQNHLDMIPYPPGVSSINQLIESDGNLFIIQTGWFSSETGSFATYTVFRLNTCPSGRKWFWLEMKSLKNQSLFIGTSSLLIPVEEESGLTNRVQYHKWYLQPQSIQVQDYNNGDGNPPVPQISQIYDFDAAILRISWIQPPQ